MIKTSTLAGKIGEDFAVSFLKKNNYQILARNFHSRFGELDVVAQELNTLVFVEIKTRWSKNFGNPEEAVNLRKLGRIERAAQYFKLLHPKTPDNMRIDVVATEVKDGKVVHARILKNVTGF